MLWTPEERWDRLARGLFWMGCLFAVFTAYGVYSGDDWRGIVMTLVPGAIVFALWYMARARADYHAAGTRMPLPAKLIAATVVLAGVALVIHTIRMAPQLQIVTRENTTDPASRLQGMKLDNLEVVDGTLRRKAPAPEPECAEVVSVADPREGHEGEQVEVCKRWAEPPR